MDWLRSSASPIPKDSTTMKLTLKSNWLFDTLLFLYQFFILTTMVNILMSKIFNASSTIIITLILILISNQKTP